MASCRGAKAVFVLPAEIALAYRSSENEVSVYLSISIYLSIYLHLCIYIYENSVVVFVFTWVY